MLFVAVQVKRVNGCRVQVKRVNGLLIDMPTHGLASSLTGQILYSSRTNHLVDQIQYNTIPQSDYYELVVCFCRQMDTKTQLSSSTQKSKLIKALKSRIFSIYPKKQANSLLQLFCDGNI